MAGEFQVTQGQLRVLLFLLAWYEVLAMELRVFRRLNEHHKF